MHKQPLFGEKPEEDLGSWLLVLSLEESDSLAPRFCFGVCFSRCLIKTHLSLSLYVQLSWNGKLQVHSLLAWLAFSQKLECAVGMGAGTAGKRATACRNQRKRLPGRSTEHHSYFWAVITEEGGRSGKDGLQETHSIRKCNLPPPRFHVKKQMFRVPT